MDVFCEHLVAKKKDILDYFLIFAIAGTALVLTYILMMFSQFASIVLLLIFGCWWGAVQLIKGRSIEYEYILTNSELDIDRIVAKSRRKRVCSLDFKQIELCASVSDPTFASVYNNPGKKTVKNFAGDINADNVYFVDYSDDTQQMRVIFQPSKRMLDSIKKANMRFVNVKEGDL
ncbi:MAG: DUF6106 family protein [Clostridia bacterium]|nr:DUF6106 family protein [Clostridia bacterium]